MAALVASGAGEPEDQEEPETPTEGRSPQSDIAQPWEPGGAPLEIMLSEPPDGLLEPALLSVLEASRRIRMERMSAYHFSSQLRLSSHEEIRFEPIVQWPRLSVPFAYNAKNREPANGYIRLIGSKDPLWVHLTLESDHGYSVARIWALALLGFAALTCPPNLTPSGQRAIHTRRGLAYGRTAASSRPLRSQRYWSSELKIKLQRGEAMPHLVCAHRRVLQDGHEASDEAILAARQVGITLTPAETWVRGHTRGGTNLTNLAFTWACPETRYLPR
jgi:hypothetical protein